MDELAGEILATVARHGVVDEALVAVHQAPVERERVGAALRWLASKGLLGEARMPSGELCFWVTVEGVEAAGCSVAAPMVTAQGLRADLAAAWAWVFPADGRFPTAEVLTERDLTARDLPLLDAGAGVSDRSGPCGLRVGGAVHRDQSGLHHPAVGILWPDAWAAAEVLLGWPDPRELSALLSGYGSDARYDRVVFLVEDLRVARVVDETISAMGLSQSARARLLPFGFG